MTKVKKEEVKKLDTIEEILSSIQLNLKVSKEKTNAFGKYKYRNAEDILAAIKEELSHEIYPACFVVTDIEPTLIGDRFFIKCEAKFSSKSEWISANGFAELEERKKTLDGIVNTKIKTLKAGNPKMSRSSLEKAARSLAFLEIRELDKENK